MQHRSAVERTCCGRRALSAGKVALVAALAALVGCSDGAEGPQLLGTAAASAARGPLRVSPPAADRLGSTIPSSRTGRLRAGQSSAGPAYDFQAAWGHAVARTPSQAFRAELSDGAVRVEPSSAAARWSLELRWTGIGSGTDVRPVARPAREPTLARNLATYHRSDGSQEWYLNGPHGLEQGFVVPERPEGCGELVLELTVGGSLRPARRVGGQSVVLMSSSRAEPVLQYTDLVARDADGVALDAWMTVEAEVIQLHVDHREAVYPVHIDPLVWAELHRLVGSDIDLQDWFGFSVATTADVAIVGARHHATDGAAYVFHRDYGGTDQWGEITKLTASDNGFQASFGSSVAIDGDVAVVGARYDSEAAEDAGAAYVFYRDQGGTDAWGEVAKLIASDAQALDNFGSPVAIDGDVIIAGADAENAGGSDAGAAYVFYRDQGGTDAWGEVVKLTASDPQALDRFGRSVALSGTVAIVGADGKNTADDWSGAAYVFYRDQGGMDSWGEVVKLTASDPAEGERFGVSVAIEGDVAVVGADASLPYTGDPGAAYVFYRDQGGQDAWGEVVKLTASDASVEDYFGASVALSGTLAIVGADGEGPGGSQIGAAYLFSRDQGGTDSWGEVTKLTASDGAAGDLFGISVAASSGVLVVGASEKDTNGNNAGAAYVLGLRLDDGDPCTLESECASGYCVDTVCCNSDCGAGDPDDCQACSIASGAAEDGTCGAVTDGAPCANGTCESGVCEPPGVGGSGTGGSGTGATGTGGSSAPAGGEPDDDGGCGCRLEATRQASSAWPTLGLLGLALAFARRRTSRLGRAA